MTNKRRRDASQERARLPWRSIRLLLLVGVLVGLAVTWGFFQWGRSPAVEGYVQRGIEALRQHDPRTALRFAEKAVGYAPDNVRAKLLAGHATAELAQFERALAYFLEVPDDGSPEAVTARVEAGDLFLLHFGQLSAAEDQFRRALEQDPLNLKANDHLGFILGISSRNWEIIPYRLKLIELDHIEPLHLYLLCLGEKALENDHMVDDFHQQNPEDPAPLLAMSRLAFEEQDYERAEQLARRVLEQQRGPVEAHVKLGHALLAQEAASEMNRWERELPEGADEHPGIWAIRAALADRQGEADVAARCHWETLRLSANHSGANYQLGQYLASSGNPSEAQRFLDRALRLQEYLNVVKVAISHRTSEEFEAAGKLAEQLGLIHEAYAWYRLCLTGNQAATGLRERLQHLRSQFAQPHGRPQSRNLADANPALEIDLSSLPLPHAAGVEQPLAVPSTETASATVSFEEQASRAGLQFQYFNSGDPAQSIGWMYEFTGGGIGVLDFDGDGWPDIHLTQGCRWPPDDSVSDPSEVEHLDRLFRNRGDGTAQDVTTQARLVENGFSQGIAVGDYDHDGFPDLYIANIGGNRLYRNNGDGTFSDVTELSGTAGQLWTSSAALADLDNDGLLDLYSVNYLGGDRVFTTRCKHTSGRGPCMPQHFPAAQDQLFLNQGDGTFADITHSAGVERPDGKGLGIVTADFGGDGQLEVFVANDSVPNFFFRRTSGPGEPPRFEEQAFRDGLAMNRDGKAEAGMGVAAGDANQDGLLDLFVTNFYLESNTLYVQQPHLGFIDGTARARLEDPGIHVLGFGTQFLDADLDGRPDLFVANGHIDNFTAQDTPYQMPPHFYRNVGNGRYQLEASRAGEYFQRRYLGRAAARLDWNRDGREDLVVGHLDAPVALLINTTRNPGHSVSFRLVGTKSARDPIGSLIEVKARGKTYRQQLTAGDGYQSSNQRHLVFGLGSATKIDSVLVRWPSGEQEEFRDVPLDAELTIVEGSEQMVVQPTPSS